MATRTAIDSSRPAWPSQRYPLSRLRLFQLISPTLPVGAFAYSQGLEYAVQAGWIKDAQGAADWIHGVLRYSVSTLDIPVLKRLYRSWQVQDHVRVRDWSRFLMACRETRELRDEERHMGSALARLAVGLGIGEASQWIDDDQTTYAAMFTLVAVHWQIGKGDAASGYLWSWLENQVIAAVKLIPLGQTEGQRIIATLAEQVPACVEAGLRAGVDEIESTVPGVLFASALHETQHTRLFRS